MSQTVAFGFFFTDHRIHLSSTAVVFLGLNCTVFESTLLLLFFKDFPN
uniref:Uncharacterized protein n=1 Tax=Anguilla anguilla TaxID=7936 RepID=A0A0E9WD85_ANGAN